jgi:ESCRT-I complex subunit VPS37
MQEVQQTKVMILASNRSLAEQNLQLQPRLNHQKSQLTTCYSSLQESFEAYQVHKSKLGNRCYRNKTRVPALFAILAQMRLSYCLNLYI